MKPFKYIIPFSLAFLSCANAEVRSNHSYKNMGFTQLPVVTIGGYIDFTAALGSQEDLYSEKILTYYDPVSQLGKTIKNKNTDDVVFADEAAILFTVSGLNDYGFKYGAVFELRANATSASWNNDINATKSYIYGEGIFGKFEFGNDIGVSQKMKIGAELIAKGGGGINGKYLNFINLPMITDGSQVAPAFILLPQHPTAHNGFGVGFNSFYSCDAGDTECYENKADGNFQLLFEEMQNATKISYYTPVIYGIQAGVSYTPDTGNKGTPGRLSTKLDDGDIDDVLEYGINYADSFYNVGVSIGFTGEIGKSEAMNKTREDLNSMQIGGSISYSGLTFAGSYGNWGTSLYDKIDKNIGDGTYYTVGASYEFGGFGVSGTYFTSEFQKNEFTAFSVDLEYKVARGFLPYIEYTNFDFKPHDKTIEKNKGMVIMAGVLVNF